MKKRINVVTNHTNGAGLEKDGRLLVQLLEARGHEVRKVQFDSPRVISEAIIGADLNIFLEVVVVGLIPGATQNWMVPNSEWWFDHAWASCLGRFTRVLCKTRDCYDIWVRKVGQTPCRFIGWEAQDYYLPEVPRQKRFLHLAGKSETKNTAAVMDAWRNYRIPYPLTVSAFKPSIVSLCKNVPNVTHVERFPEADVPRIMNEHQFFIMPSKYEGFGMAIHEALSCGGIVLTTNAQPMASFSGIPQNLLCGVNRREPVRAAVFNHADPAHIAEQVEKAAKLPADEIAQLSKEAREGFLRDNEFFQKAIAGVLHDAGF